DQDGAADKLFFVGTGGAHLFYFLRIETSSNGKQKDFRFIESDFPVLPADSIMKSPGHRPNDQTFFTVFDNDVNKKPTIFVRLDQQTFQSNRRQLRKKGIKTDLVTI